MALRALRRHRDAFASKEAESSNDDSVMFDPASAASHGYLGSVTQIRGRYFLPTNTRVRIPLYPLRGVVLFPGETLPLKIHSQSSINMIRELLREVHFPP